MLRPVSMNHETVRTVLSVRALRVYVRPASGPRLQLTSTALTAHAQGTGLHSQHGEVVGALPPGKQYRRIPASYIFNTFNVLKEHI